MAARLCAARWNTQASRTDRIAAAAAKGAIATNRRLIAAANAIADGSGRASDPAPKIRIGMARGMSIRPARAAPPRRLAVSAAMVRPIAARPGVPASRPSSRVASLSPAAQGALKRAKWQSATGVRTPANARSSGWPSPLLPPRRVERVGRIRRFRDPQRPTVPAGGSPRAAPRPRSLRHRYARAIAARVQRRRDRALQRRGRTTAAAAIRRAFHRGAILRDRA